MTDICENGAFIGSGKLLWQHECWSKYTGALRLPVKNDIQYECDIIERRSRTEMRRNVLTSTR